MFTGIIECVGTLISKEKWGSGYAITVKAPSSFLVDSRVRIGDSVANNGVCLTVTAKSGDTFTADISHETVARTCFRDYQQGQTLNLELACTPSTHLGGHIVQGHVDGVGEVSEVKKSQDSIDVLIRIPHELMRYIAKKGSIAVNGVSLTVNDVFDDRIRLTLIRHTQKEVSADIYTMGCRVNIEVDVLARYLERLMMSQEQSLPSEEVLGHRDTGKSSMSLDSLRKNGFF